ncbi:MAG: hypothetical protein ACUVT7_09445, partial [Thermoplasmata archaeon]
MRAAIQVVMCRCCTEMPALLDVARLERVASEAPMVVSVRTVGAVCDGKDLATAVKEAKDKGADRVVVLACHKKDLSPLLVRAYKRAGVNEFLVETVNVREEVVLPHLKE